MAFWTRTTLPRRSPARQVTFLVGLFGLLALIGCQPELIPLPQPLPATPTAPVETVRVVTMVVHPTETVDTTQAGNPTQAVNPPDVSSTPSPAAEPGADMANLLAMPAIQVKVSSNGGDGFVNVRSGPGALYGVVGKIPEGATVAAIAVSEHGEWLLIHLPSDPNRVVWLYRLYTNFDPVTQKLPVIKNIPAAATPAP